MVWIVVIWEISFWVIRQTPLNNTIIWGYVYIHFNTWIKYWLLSWLCNSSNLRIYRVYRGIHYHISQTLSHVKCSVAYRKLNLYTFTYNSRSLRWYTKEHKINQVQSKWGAIIRDSILVKLIGYSEPYQLRHTKPNLLCTYDSSPQSWLPSNMQKGSSSSNEFVPTSKSVTRCKGMHRIAAV